MKNIDVDPRRALGVCLGAWLAGFACTFGIYLSEGYAELVWALTTCFFSFIGCLGGVLTAIGLDQERSG